MMFFDNHNGFFNHSDVNDFINFLDAACIGVVSGGECIGVGPGFDDFVDFGGFDDRDLNDCDFIGFNGNGDSRFSC
jgi:hypothetical protein